jgi:hypothetical protein
VRRRRIAELQLDRLLRLGIESDFMEFFPHEGGSVNL